VTRGSRRWPFGAAGPPLLSLLLIVGGLALRAGPSAVWGERTLWWGLVAVGTPVAFRTLVGALRGRLAADLVASLAIVGAVVLDEPLAGLVVVLMQTGGEALEHYAAGRASRAVQELEAAAPRLANRLDAEERVSTIPAGQVAAGDRLLVRPGEMVPCDAEVISGRSHVDLSRLTGEPIPVSASAGTRLPSGGLNIDGPLTLRATAVAGESQYARIVELVRRAQASKSPMQRLADRVAVYFTPATLLAAWAAWVASGDPKRSLAVLVVATPCPLILAVPVAVIGGINRAARRSVIIRHGEALERLGTATAALLDKTGTLTIGRPLVCAVDPEPPFGEAELLMLAASVEAGSGHMLARSVVAAAEERDLKPLVASAVAESPGEGVSGVVGGRRVLIGARRYVAREAPEARAGFTAPIDGNLRAWVAVDGRAAGTIEFADRLRTDARQLVDRLRQLGFRRILLITGDHGGSATRVAREAGITEVHADLLAVDKVRFVETLEEAGDRVLMVGDGTNDAPALSRASVGVALAAHGGGITAEAADVVILADEPARVAEAIEISRATMRIARQSVGIGLGLSATAMLVAAFGYIPPTAGALLQEVVDVAVILNALRASTDRIP
jgi:heavy metal translocating P-type ATPase